MARPRDYGEKFPGDSDDVDPVDPTDGRVEIDYDIGSGAFDTLEQPMVEVDPLVPDADIEPVQLTTPDAVTGTILAWANDKNDFPRLYWVTEQSGGLGVARTENNREGADYRPGDSVTMVEGTEENTYLITATQRPDELSGIDLAFTSVAGKKLESSGPFKVEFDTVLEEFPVDNTWGRYQDLTLGVDADVIVGDDGVFDIFFNVTVEHADPDATSVGSRMALGTGCVPANGVNTENASVYKLLFDRSAGFKLELNEADCTHSLTFSASPDMMLNVYDDYNSGRPVWTDSPRIGKSFQIGTQDAQAWVKIGPGYSHAWIGAGRQSSKMMYRLPPKEPTSSCDYLVVDAYTPPQLTGYLDDLGVPHLTQAGHLVELGWRQPGGTGIVKGAYQIDEYTIGGYQVPIFEAVEYVVENGLIISGYCISPTVCNKTGVHYDTRDKGIDSCNPDAVNNSVTLRGQFDGT
jgi:hypothetical protein